MTERAKERERNDEKRHRLPHRQDTVGRQKKIDSVRETESRRRERCIGINSNNIERVEFTVKGNFRYI